MRSRAWTWAAALAVAGALGSGGVARADTITVTTHGDPSGPAVACPGLNCSLRQAAATAPDGSTIRFAEPGTYTVDEGSPIVIPRSLTIDGTGGVTVDGRQNAGTGGTYRIFTVNAGVTATLENLTLTGAHTVFGGSDPFAADGGGALFVPAGATANVSHVVFTGNFALLGAAVSSAGTLHVADSWFHDDNSAGGLGSGIAVKGGTTSIDRTTLQDEQDGSAIYIYGGAQVTVTNSTVYGSGLPSGMGGGITNHAGTLSLVDDTLAGNVQGSLETDTGATTSVQGTIIADGFDEGHGDCVAAGLPQQQPVSAKAITHDLGDNLDQDDSCGLNADNGGHPGVDPHLALPADNGGTGPTLAVLHDSPALDGGGDCTAAVDGRGQARPIGQACDIGAFEAVRQGPPVSVTTQPATDLTPNGATLNARVDLDGEAGGAHFFWGTSPGALDHETPVGGSGLTEDAAVLLSGLDPKTTYYFRAVADNATGSLADSDHVLSFTTPPPGPEVSGVESSAVTDTTAQLDASIDPQGEDTSYVVRYGTTDAYGQTTAPVDIGSGTDFRQITASLTGLHPGTTYHVNVVAFSDGAPNGVGSGDATFTTEPQVAAVAGQTVTVNDETLVEGRCPTATIDWGDPPGTAEPVEPTCTDQGNGLLRAAVTATHTYAAPGHYPIEIAYSAGGASEQWALISAPQQATPTPTPTPTPTATATPSPTPTVTPTPAPVFHRQVVVRPVSGTVLVRRKGTHTFVPLDAKAGVPLGSQVDVTHGRIALTSVPHRGGKPQTAQFYAGIFTVTQSGSVTVLTLSGPKPTCSRPRGRASAAAKKKKVKSRKLWGDGHGSFRTSGQYSAATVRGTQWLVQDTCAGTLTRVAHGLVAVTDRVRHKTVLVRGGKSYLARPRRRH